MSRPIRISGRRTGLTLAELVVALVVCSLVIIGVLAVYGRAYDSASVVLEKIELSRLPSEIMQRIEEDLGGLMTADRETRIRFENKLASGITMTRLEISRSVYDKKNQPQILDKVIWQTDTDLSTGLITLYRAHGGLSMEDKLLDEQKETWERELFIPVCEGLTLFKVGVPQGEEMLSRWQEATLPPAVVVTMSFGESYRGADGIIDVAETDKIVRTITIDRTKKSKLTIPTDINEPDSNEPDSNDIGEEAQEPNEPRANESIDEQARPTTGRPPGPGPRPSPGRKP